MPLNDLLQVIRIAFVLLIQKLFSLLKKALANLIIGLAGESEVPVPEGVREQSQEKNGVDGVANQVDIVLGGAGFL